MKNFLVLKGFKFFLWYLVSVLMCFTSMGFIVYFLITDVNGNSVPYSLVALAGGIGVFYLWSIFSNSGEGFNSKKGWRIVSNEN